VEDAECKDFVVAVDLISVMQARARRFLARQSATLTRDRILRASILVHAPWWGCFMRVPMHRLVTTPVGQSELIQAREALFRTSWEFALILITPGVAAAANHQEQTALGECPLHVYVAYEDREQRGLPIGTRNPVPRC